MMIASKLQIDKWIYCRLQQYFLQSFFEGMASSISIQQDSKLNNTLSGNKQSLKIKDMDSGSNKSTLMADKKVNNIDDLVKLIEFKFQFKQKQNPYEVIIIVDNQKEEIEFKDDEDFLNYFEKTRIVNFCRVPIEMCKRFRKDIEKEKTDVKQEQTNVLDKQILQDNYSAPKSEKLEETERLKIIEQVKQPEKSVKESKPIHLVQGIFESILKEPGNLRKVAQLLQGSSNSSSQPVLFDISCSFCKKSQRSNKIYACEMNLSVISCQQCQPFLHYRIPLPFKAFTNPKRYQTELSSQSPTAISTFNDNMRVERSMRNKNLKEKLGKLSIQA